MPLIGLSMVQIKRVFNFPNNLVVKNYKNKLTKLSYIFNIGIALYARSISIKKD